ncbi:MAG TPA: DedA family protein [Nitrospiria bacterium]|jgi:membrane protein DedA with SNARE-associated domain
MEILIQWVTEYGYLAIFILLVLGLFGLPVPDEVLLTFSGFLVFQGVLQPFPAYSVAFVGSVCGISISYSLGRFVGTPVLQRYGRCVRLSPEKMNRVHFWFETYGKWTIFFGYFIPGVRHATAIVAGASKLEYHVFALFAFSGGLIWSSLYVSLGYFLGNEWEKVSRWFPHRIWGISLTFAAVLVFYLLLRKMNSKPKEY